jgi:hypothetical protein
MKKTRSTMSTDTIGKRLRSKEGHRDSCFLFGDSTMKRKRNTSLLSAGTHDTRTCSPYHWVVMTSQNKKPDRFLYGP